MRRTWYELAQSLSNIKIVQLAGYPTDIEMAQVVLVTGLVIICETLNDIYFDTAD